jgi:hypothetical protein
MMNQWREVAELAILNDLDDTAHECKEIYSSKSLYAIFHLRCFGSWVHMLPLFKMQL